MKVPTSSESGGCLSWTPRWYLCPAATSSQGRRQSAEWGIGTVTWQRLEGADLHPWILSWGLQSLPWRLCFIVSCVLKDHPLIEAYWQLHSNVKIGGIWNGWEQLLVSVPWCGCLFVITVFFCLVSAVLCLLPTPEPLLFFHVSSAPHLLLGFQTLTALPCCCGPAAPQPSAALFTVLSPFPQLCSSPSGIFLKLPSNSHILSSAIAICFREY